MKKDAPIYKERLEDVARVFSAFNTAYSQLFGHYESSDAAHMREFLGDGILPSYHTIAHRQTLPTEARKPASRVGLALNTFHVSLLNAGKKWGSYFDASRLEDKDLAAALKYIEDAELPTPPEDFHCPRCLHDKQDHHVTDFLLEKFEKLQEVPLRVNKKPLMLPPKQIIQRRATNEVDSVCYEYPTPMAAIFWGIHHAGMSIKGRPEGSPMRMFLEKTIGLADDAGQKIIELHNWAPEIFSDYGQNAIAKALHDQRFWIKAAYAVSTILNRRSSERKAFAEVVGLIGEDVSQPDFHSAGKAAVILHAWAERLERIKRDAEKTPTEDSALQGELRKRLNATHQGIGVNAAIQGLYTLSAALAEIGRKTEKQLEEAKREDHQHRPYAEKYYTETAHVAFTNQSKELATLMTARPELRKPAEAGCEFARELRDLAQIHPDAVNYINHAVKFCQLHLAYPQWVVSPQRPGAQVIP